MNPKIAVIGDGYSDFLVIKKFIESVFEEYHKVNLKKDDFYHLKGLTINNELSKYIQKANKEKYPLVDEYATQYRKDISTILWTALKKFEDEKGSELTNKDVLVLTSDSEHVLGKIKSVQHRDNFLFSIGAVTWFAIEEFYNKKVLHECTNYKNLPLILPLIFSPSSEILVAACSEHFEKDRCRDLKPNPDLKVKVYGSANIPYIITNERLERVLHERITPENLKMIYKFLPEIRKVMQILTFAPSVNI